jgi:membrane protein YdbS with pleckstrin-like domain
MAHEDSLSDGERQVLILHQHWKVLVGPLALAVVVVAVALAAEVLIPKSREANVERLAVAVAAIGLIMVWLTVPLLRWRTTRYELTSRRLQLREGVIARRGRDIPLSRITDVSFAKGPLDRLLGCGRLVVESAGEHGEVTLNDIPRVERVQRILFQLVEEERLRIGREDRGIVD